MTTEKKEDTALIGSVCRALDIIQYMAHRQEEVSVSEIAKALGMYRSMVFRMLYTLRYKGFVEQNPDNEKYRLGIKLLVLGHSLDRRSHFIKFIRPFAQKASQAFHETVNVSILDHRTDLQGYCGLIIHQESSQRGINANTRIGSLRECYCSAVVQPVEQVQSYARSIRKKQHGEGLIAYYTLDDMIGKSLAIRQLKREILKYAGTHSNVLITGESGTGKEMIAQAMHNLSQCSKGPFVAINCGAFTESLLESELFGYEEGTFTGAKKGGKAGVFELADGGTLFLDEIGDMPYVLQNRLLRVLQERAVMRVGGSKVIPVDVRIIAATNQNLEKDIEEKKFRLDLYYRLDVLRIRVPALRERDGDISLLARIFLANLNKEYGRNKGFDKEVLHYLTTLPWPGNIRQLNNIVERMVLLSEGRIITMEDAAEALELDIHAEKGTAKKIDMEQIEGLLSEGKSYAEIAELLGVSRSTLWRYRRNKK